MRFFLKLGLTGSKILSQWGYGTRQFHSLKENMRHLYINPLLLCDTYKLSHRQMLPPGCNLTYTNITARKSRVDGVDNVVVFGLQYFIQEYLIDRFQKDFFLKPKEEVVGSFEKFVSSCCGTGVINSDHVSDLYDLGYLPLVIKSVKEGTVCPIGVPFCTVYNTHKNFGWLTNFIETIMQCVLWRAITSATDCKRLRQLGDKFAEETSDALPFVDWQFHTFGMRGSDGLECAILSDAGHLLNFTGSDTVPTLPFMEYYYGAKIGQEIVSMSVPASEHAVVCAYGEEGEIDTFRHIMQDVYPRGILSMISDSWDLTEIINPDNGYLVKLKQEILDRDGKLVIRPDSSDKTPLEVICGDDKPESKYNERQRPVIEKGVLRCLDEIFGSTINSKGYKELNAKIGLIYGEALSYELLGKIFDTMKEMGYASTNLTCGIGSAFHMYNRTRDTYSIVCKSTYCEVNGEGRNIFKDPVTDSGSKKSMKGLLKVNTDFSVQQECTWDEEGEGILEEVFKDGILLREETLAGIRERLASQ